MGLIVGVDIDGVLADWVTSFAALLASRYGPPPNGLDLSRWSWPEASGYTKPQISSVWESVTNDQQFWKSLPPYATTSADLFYLRKLWVAGADIYFITSRVGVDVKLQTEMWLNEFNTYQGFGVPNPTVLICHEKGLACKALGVTHFIDDKPANCVQVFRASPDTKVFLFDRPWNQQDNGMATRIPSIAHNLGL